MNRQLLHIIFLFFPSFSLLCQERYILSNLSEAHGLSDNRVTCFLKDKDGYMWIGTENGLNRYNGYAFTIYKPGLGQYAISNEHINDVEQDSSGRMYIATNGGLNILDNRKKTLEVLHYDPSGLPNELIWDTQVDKKGRLWIAADNRDLCYYETVHARFVNFPWKKFVTKLYPSRKDEYSSIQKIQLRSDHSLWLGTTLGLFSFDMDTQTFEYIGGDIAKDFKFLYDDQRAHKVFFVQELEKLNEVDYSGKQTVPINLKKQEYQWQHASSNFLFALNDELIEIDPLHDNYINTSARNENYFLNFSEKINTLYYDDDSLVWVGTMHGAFRYDPKLNPFHFTTIMKDSVNGSNYIYAVHYEDEEKKYYITSPISNTLYIIDKYSGTRQEINNVHGMPLEGCSKIYEDSKKQLWILGKKNVFIYNRATKAIATFSFPDKYFSPVVTMIEDVEGTYWFGSSGQGLLTYNPVKKIFYKPPQADFNSKMVFSFCNDRQHHALWIGSFERGLYRYDLHTAKFEHFNADVKDAYQTHSALVYDIIQDKDGNIWAATYNGLEKYTYGKTHAESFTNYSVETGLPENIVYSMALDKMGNIWFNTFKGLACIDTKGKILSVFGKTKGLLFNNFSNPINTTPDGEIVLGIENGFIHFFPDSLSFHSARFPVVINNWNVSGKQVDLPGLAKTRYKFNYQQNEMQFDFAALTYSLPEQVQYQYKLDGWDKDWIQAGNNHFARYTNLSDGHYVFKVHATDHSGRSSENDGIITFDIYPPFWKTWWFIGSLISLAIVLLYLWIRSFQQKIRTEKLLNSITASLFEQRTMEDISWDIAHNCVHKLGFVDCVVYITDDEKNILVQKAACGPKNPQRREILNPIEISMGQGIVGYVAQSGVAEIVNNTSKDKRYITDDAIRLSEISVPIVAGGNVYGVIDSEHPSKNFFSKKHLYLLKEIGEICALRISKYITEERLRTKIARDLHDDMGSALSSININSKMALQNAQQNTIVQGYLQKIKDNSGNMLESMSDIVWAINPANDTLEKIIIRMKEFAAEILEPLNINYSFKGELVTEQVKLDLNKRKNLYLIFKEAINNAAKYSQCHNIEIELKKESQNIKLLIRDDGMGFKIEQSRQGNGLRNMNERARSIHALLEIESSIGNGTAVQLHLPIT